MRGIIGTSLFALVIVGCADAPTSPRALALGGPSLAATTTTTNQVIPFAQGAFVACANGGAGEVVLISGNLHVLSHVTVSNSGNVSAKVHFQPQGATGVGQTTGDIYRATGVTQEHENVNGPLPYTNTFINNFRVIGPGPGNNLLVHVNTHVTINANGDVTSTVNNVNIDCK